MKKPNYIPFAIVSTVGLSILGAYLIVTARSFPHTAVYHGKSNFVALLMATAAFLLLYNCATQLTMYFWYKWDLARVPYYIQKLFPRLTILFFTVVLLLFIEFVLGLRGASLASSEYMEVEFPLFLLYFSVIVSLTIFLPGSNPWDSLMRKARPKAMSTVPTVTLQHKQETLHLPYGDIPVLIFIRKRSICICREGRQMYAPKLNSATFLETKESEEYIRVNRSTFVRKDVVEGYCAVKRDKFLVFRSEIRVRIDRIMEDPSSYAIGWSPRENITAGAFKISAMYWDTVRKMLEERMLADN